MNDLAELILPVSSRAAGLRDDTRLGKRLGRHALETIRAPTLVVSAHDDGFALARRRSTPPDASLARSSSASTKAATCSLDTTLRVGPK